MALGEVKATANPTKGFFVRMITRDIALEDCILDLIDNSVDGAWRTEGSRPMGLSTDADLSPYSIEINARSGHFSIKDNCGGMSLSDAADHAFSFGRSSLDEHDDYSIGVYGIGMKRAVFKIGRDIRIRSTHLNAVGENEVFAVPINVVTWLNNDAPPWDFDIVEDEPLDSTGVEIAIGNLTDGTESAFSNPSFIQNLKRTIARDYSLHLSRGLRVSVNDEPVVGWHIELRQSDEFEPVRLEYPDDADGDAVVVEIIAGMAAPPPDDSGPDEDDDGDKRFGWYVICNGRIVLAADKTTISGWGTPEWPQWHQQYSGFIGIILFTAAKAAALPLTTTKRSVDTSSEVYRRARPKMREVSKQWIAYTNQRKQAREEAKLKEAQAVPISIYAVPRKISAKLPTLTSKPMEPVANINYSVPLVRMRKLATALGGVNIPYKDVGLKSFEYTYGDLVGED